MFFFPPSQMLAFGSQSSARWTWEANAGETEALQTKTTPSIVKASLFPCLAVLIITPRSQTETKNSHILKRGMRNMHKRSTFPPSLSTNILLFGALEMMWARWDDCGDKWLPPCSASVRTVCGAHCQCQLLTGWRMWINAINFVTKAGAVRRQPKGMYFAAL